MLKKDIKNIDHKKVKLSPDYLRVKDSAEKNNEERSSSRVNMGIKNIHINNKGEEDP